MHDAGKVLMLIGVVLVFLGAFVTFVHKVPYLGKLPGDLLIQKKNFTLYFPFATSIVVSIILSFFFWLWSRR
ncbi:MAG: DUF2905 domain-containing protein [Candidatus Omnitrophota bacterium]